MQELRAEVSRPKKAEHEPRREHASEVRELKGALAAYANQIQVLTLRNAELEGQNTRFVERLRRSGENLAVLPAPGRPSP